MQVENTMGHLTLSAVKTKYCIVNLLEKAFENKFSIKRLKIDLEQNLTWQSDFKQMRPI